MKKLIVAFCSMVVMTASAQALEVKTIADIPNVRACTYYDFVGCNTGIGVESTLLRYKAVDLSVGYVQIDNAYTGTAAISLNLNKINIPNLEYAWKDLIHTSVGLWGGYSMQTQKWSAGINISLIKFEK
jgi:hypothetical protein